MYLTKTIKSNVPKSKRDDIDIKSYFAFRKINTQMLFHNLGHIIDKDLMALTGYVHRSDIAGLTHSFPSVLAVYESDQVMTFFNEAIQDDDI